MEADLMVLAGVTFAALGMALWAMMRNREVDERITFESVADTLSDIETAAGAARELVLAAEQLYETGRLAKNERFAWVLSRLADIHPAIDDDTLVWAIEAAVKAMKLARAAL